MPKKQRPWFKVKREFAFADTKKLSKAGIRVYLCLAYHRNDLCNEAWASVKTMADELGMTEREVYRGLADLKCNAGHLVDFDKYNLTAKITGNLYRIPLTNQSGVPPDNPDR